MIYKNFQNNFDKGAIQIIRNILILVIARLIDHIFKHVTFFYKTDFMAEIKKEKKNSFTCY